MIINPHLKYFKSHYYDGYYLLTGFYCIRKPNLKFNSANAENMTRQGRKVSCQLGVFWKLLAVSLSLLDLANHYNSSPRLQFLTLTKFQIIFDQILKQYFSNKSSVKCLGIYLLDIHTFILCANNTKQRSIIYPNKLSVLARTTVLGHLIHELK